MSKDIIIKNNLVDRAQHDDFVVFLSHRLILAVADDVGVLDAVVIDIRHVIFCRASRAHPGIDESIVM
jgi:hypothetical protein